MSSATMTITGFASEPRSTITQAGRAMTSISVAHSPRRKNKQTGEWEDVTDKYGNKIVLWARGTWFDSEADHFASTISKGDLLELEGEPRINIYTNNEGATTASIDLQFAKLKVLPRAAKNDQQQPGSFGGGQAQQQWAQPSAQEQRFMSQPGFDDEQPF